MKSIEERAWEKYPEVIKHHNLACIDINEEKRKMYIEIVTEQKAIDDAILLKLKSAWEKEAQTNHDDELNYKQGYHDAIEKACDWLKKNFEYYVDVEISSYYTYKDKLVEDFRKAIEE